MVTYRVADRWSKITQCKCYPCNSRPLKHGKTEYFCLINLGKIRTWTKSNVQQALGRNKRLQSARLQNHNSKHNVAKTSTWLPIMCISLDSISQHHENSLTFMNFAVEVSKLMPTNTQTHSPHFPSYRFIISSLLLTFLPPPPSPLCILVFFFHPRFPPSFPPTLSFPAPL